MLYGYAGKILRVDLTSHSLRDEVLDGEVARRYLGGRGLGAKILFDEVKPGIDPLGPENKLVFATGVLTGIHFAGDNRYAVMAKSPLTGGWGEAHAGGYFGPEMKYAGYDAIIIGGISEQPVYLWIHDGEAGIRDASHLWGKATADVERIIREEWGDEEVRVACIGPGGESRVRYACIVSDRFFVAGRSGLGAVMGSKGLKAIAIRGRGGLKYANDEGLKRAVRRAQKEVNDDPYTRMIYLYGSAGDVDDLNAIGLLPTKNFVKCIFDGAEKITGERMTEEILVKRATCYGCPMAHKRVVEAEKPYRVDPAYGGPEYESAAALGSLCMNDNLVAVAKANELCNKYGIDTISTGVSIAFAMECYEKGLITREDTDGIDLSWGNHEAILDLIPKIAYRQGFGDMLAEGVKRMAERIGRGSRAWALHVKGQEVPMHEPRGKKGIGLSYATSNRGACHLQSDLDDAFESEDALRPELGFDSRVIPQDRLEAGERKALLVKLSQDLTAVYDSLIACKWTIGSIRIGTLIDIINKATGWTATPRELMRIGERIYNLCRAFNIREGFSRKDDTLPARLMQPLPEGPYKGEAIPQEMLEEMLDHYYGFRGWDKETGIPLKNTLEELDLKGVAEELISQGLLK